MVVLKRIAIFCLTSLFSISLFGLALVVGINNSVAKADNIKRTFQQAGMYSAVAEEIQNQLVDGAADQPGEINRAVLSKVADKVITPQLVEANLDQVIDGVYVWMNGDTEIPEFEINVAQVETKLKSGLLAAAVARLAKLPACNYAQLSSIDPNNVDPFTVVCNPGLDKQTLESQFAEVSSADGGLLGDSTKQGVFSSVDIKGDDGQNVFKNADSVPQIYQTYQYLPWVLLLVIAVIVLILIKMYGGWQIASRKLGLALLSSGIFLIVVVLISKSSVSSVVSDIQIEQLALQTAVREVVQLLVASINKTLLIFGGVYLILGVVGLFLPKYLIQRKS